MKKSDAMKFVDERIDDLKSVIADLKINDQISKNTRGTQLYAKGREKKTLELINELIKQIPNDVVLSDDGLKTFNLITELQSEKKGRKIVLDVHAGDSMMDLLTKYADVKNVYERLMKSITDAGLKLNAKTGKLE